jgi:hypothetical protein
MLAAGLPQSVLQAEFDRPSTLLLVSHGSQDSLVPHANLAYYYTSAQAAQQAVLTGQVPAGVRYLLIDLERWPLTPAGEQSDPIAALRSATTVAHQHGKCVVFAPAVDLVGVTHPGVGGSALYSEFDQTMVEPGAGQADLFAVQAQHTEGTRYASSFAPEAIQAARQGRSAEPVLVGLSTNPNGRRVSLGDILAVYRASAAAGTVGYWLNIPESGAECPRCGYPQTSVAVAFLERLAG